MLPLDTYFYNGIKLSLVVRQYEDEYTWAIDDCREDCRVLASSSFDVPVLLPRWIVIA